MRDIYQILFFYNQKIYQSVVVPVIVDELLVDDGWSLRKPANPPSVHGDVDPPLETTVEPGCDGVGTVPWSVELPEALIAGLASKPHIYVR